MHALRRSAHRRAWYNRSDDPPTYNPFGRTRSHSSRLSDIEARLNPNPSGSMSDPARPSPSELQSAVGPAVESAEPEKGAPPPNQPQAADSGVSESDASLPRHRFHNKFFGPRRETIVREKDAEKQKSPKQHFTLWSQIKGTLFNSYVNLLLFAVPVGIAANYAHLPPVAVFVINFVAIVPLAGMLSYATEEIALRVGETLGGLLNATFGNAVELIVSIIALKEREVLIVQTSLIGSILSNLLLVLGMCFFFGGINKIQQFFNVTVAQTATSLLTLSAASLIIPTVFARWSSAGGDATDQLSRGTSIILLVVYASYLFFQLKSHASLYNEKSAKAERRHEPKDATMGIAAMGAGIAASMGGENAQDLRMRNKADGEAEDDEEDPQLALSTALITLAVSTALVAICAESMVSSIDALCQAAHISKTFVGLILLPIVGNAAEHATAVTVACKDKMDLAIGVAVGSSMQIALLVLPFVVTLGWILHIDDMTLNFDGFQIAVLFVAVLIVNSLISDGKSHWLEGVLLQATYLIIAVAAWFYPD